MLSLVEIPVIFFACSNEFIQYPVTEESKRHMMLTDNELILIEDVDLESMSSITEQRKQLELYH